MYQDLQKCLSELIACNAFEMHMRLSDCYIPYMMNDALECYFVLKDCHLQGEMPGNSHAVAELELIETEFSPALIIRQIDGSVATLWFQNFQKELKCYRYHEIGHFWVKGQEQWRQLVYIVGTIYDKFEYMGADICNEKELELLPLMEFAPFRYWSPIQESLDGHYSDPSNGLEYMHHLCIETDDRKFLRYLRLFRMLPCTWITKLLGKELAKSGHEKLYERIYQKIIAASSVYPARDYGESFHQKILSERAYVTDYLFSKGFSGAYPHFQRENVSVLVTEEHPFTLSDLEYENYNFRMQFMVSECAHKPRYLNEGFFKAKGNCSKIVKSVEDIL